MEGHAIHRKALSGLRLEEATRHVEANVNTRKENKNNQNNNNEMEDVMLKGHPLPQIN